MTVAAVCLHCELLSDGVTSTGWPTGRFAASPLSFASARNISLPRFSRLKITGGVYSASVPRKVIFG